MINQMLSNTTEMLHETIDDRPDEEEGTVQCPACRAYSYNGDKYCACCGARIRRLCDDCGAIIQQPVAFYCAQCGGKLKRTPEDGDR